MNPFGSYRISKDFKDDSSGSLVPIAILISLTLLMALGAAVCSEDSEPTNRPPAGPAPTPMPSFKNLQPFPVLRY